MGHDISAYNKQNKEIAYIRYGAFTNREFDIYKALDSRENDNGVSGNGESVKFTKSQLEQGVKSVKDKQGLEAENKFLENCLNNLDKDETITVFFG